MDEDDRAALQRTNELRYKRFFDNVCEITPGTVRDLCFFTPKEVLKALSENKVVLDWHKWLLEEYEPPKKEAAILFPDTDRKPWVKGVTNDRTYKNLYIALKSLKLEDKVQVYTVSTLFGIVPMERYEDMPMYNTSGMFSWSVKKRGLEWDPFAFKEVLNSLGKIISEFMQKHRSNYDKIYAIYRVPSVHERIVETAYDLEPFKLDKLTMKKPLSQSYSKLKDLMKEI